MSNKPTVTFNATSYRDALVEGLVQSQTRNHSSTTSPRANLPVQDTFPDIQLLSSRDIEQEKEQMPAQWPITVIDKNGSPIDMLFKLAKKSDSDGIHYYQFESVNGEVLPKFCRNNLYFTEHALERVEERQITNLEIYHTLGHSHIHSYKNRKVFNNPENGVSIVVNPLTEEGFPYVIVTAIRRSTFFTNIENINCYPEFDPIKGDEDYEDFDSLIMYYEGIYNNPEEPQYRRAKAAYNLGECFTKRYDTTDPKNINQSINYYIFAAERGHLNAKLLLYSLYTSSFGCDKNTKIDELLQKGFSEDNAAYMVENFSILKKELKSCKILEFRKITPSSGNKAYNDFIKEAQEYRASDPLTLFPNIDREILISLFLQKPIAFDFIKAVTTTDLWFRKIASLILLGSCKDLIQIESPTSKAASKRGKGKKIQSISELENIEEQLRSVAPEILNSYLNKLIILCENYKPITNEHRYWQILSFLYNFCAALNVPDAQQSAIEYNLFYSSESVKENLLDWFQFFKHEVEAGNFSLVAFARALEVIASKKRSYPGYVLQQSLELFELIRDNGLFDPSDEDYKYVVIKISNAVVDSINLLIPAVDRNSVMVGKNQNHDKNVIKILVELILGPKHTERASFYESLIPITESQLCKNKNGEFIFSFKVYWQLVFAQIFYAESNLEKALHWIQSAKADLETYQQKLRNLIKQHKRDLSELAPPVELVEAVNSLHDELIPPQGKKARK